MRAGDAGRRTPMPIWWPTFCAVMLCGGVVTHRCWSAGREVALTTVCLLVRPSTAVVVWARANHNVDTKHSTHATAPLVASV